VLPLALLPASVALRVGGLVIDADTVTISLRAASASARCPDRAAPSPHVHSRYARTIRDLPSRGKATILRLTARKFFCRNPDCPRRVFCERLPDLVPRYARSTARLTEARRAIAFAPGGEAGSRLAGQLSMPTSADTLLRRIKQTTTTNAPTPRVLGVDDWAIRRGRRYGTILVDLQRGQVIGLLPGRDGPELQAWLKDHPGVEVVSRDRASAYARAASRAAPDAVRVADRWAGNPRADAADNGPAGAVRGSPQASRRGAVDPPDCQGNAPVARRGPALSAPGSLPRLEAGTGATLATGWLLQMDRRADPGWARQRR
jgi:transposase